MLRDPETLRAEAERYADEILAARRPPWVLRRGKVLPALRLIMVGAFEAGWRRGQYDRDERVSGLAARQADQPVREQRGQIVRETWVTWAKRQREPKPSWLVPWDDLDDGQREVDMLIGDAVAAAEQERIRQLAEAGEPVESPPDARRRPLAARLHEFSSSGGGTWRRTPREHAPEGQHAPPVVLTMDFEPVLDRRAQEARLAEQRAQEAREARLAVIPGGWDEALMRVCKALVPAEREAILARYSTELGAQVEDIVGMLADGDAFLEQTEPFWEQHESLANIPGAAYAARAIIAAGLSLDGARMRTLLTAAGLLHSDSPYGKGTS
jgi:hypothetical protein